MLEKISATKARASLFLICSIHFVNSVHSVEHDCGGRRVACEMRRVAAGTAASTVGPACTNPIRATPRRDLVIVIADYRFAVADVVPC